MSYLHIERAQPWPQVASLKGVFFYNSTEEGPAAGWQNQSALARAAFDISARRPVDAVNIYSPMTALFVSSASTAVFTDHWKLVVDGEVAFSTNRGRSNGIDGGLP